MTSSRPWHYLTHILQAIDRIQNYTEEFDEIAFIQNEMAQDAVIRNLEVIGEASRNIRQRYPEFADAHPELPLASAYEMRAQTRVVIEAERLDSESDSSD